jgi:hypothetical protein
VRPGEAGPVSRDARLCGDEDLLRCRKVLLAGTSMAVGEVVGNAIGPAGSRVGQHRNPHPEKGATA